MANGENGNGATIKLNTAILIWLGGLTILIAFYAGISLERLNGIADNQKIQEKQRLEKEQLIDLRLDNLDANLRALTLSYTRGEKSVLLENNKGRIK